MFINRGNWKEFFLRFSRFFQDEIVLHRNYLCATPSCKAGYNRSELRYIRLKERNNYAQNRQITRCLNLRIICSEDE